MKVAPRYPERHEEVIEKLGRSYEDPVPLEERLVGTAFLERRFRTIVGDSKVETRVDIRLCRNRWQMLQHVLAAGSVVVLGGRRRWWTTAESRLTQKLQAVRHHVVFLDEEQ